MNRSTGVDYLEPFEPGELVDGLEGIGVVEMASLRLKTCFINCIERDLSTDVTCHLHLHLPTSPVSALSTPFSCLLFRNDLNSA